MSSSVAAHPEMPAAAAAASAVRALPVSTLQRNATSYGLTEAVNTVAAG